MSIPLFDALLPVATPSALGQWCLASDRQAHRLTPEERRDAVALALADGTIQAAAVRERWGADPRAVAGALGVAVEESDADGGYGSTIVFAEYRERPPAITLYLPAIRRLDAALETSGLARLLLEEPSPACGRGQGEGNSEPGADHALTPTLSRTRERGKGATSIFLAHELYHHLDLTRSGAPLARQREVTLLRLGPWRWRSGLAALPEIAAGAFAQALLDLPFHPKLLDLVQLHLADPAAASLAAAFIAEAAAGTRD